jgi:hypothetical protein
MDNTTQLVADLTISAYNPAVDSNGLHTADVTVEGVDGRVSLAWDSQNSRYASAGDSRDCWLSDDLLAVVSDWEERCEADEDGEMDDANDLMREIAAYAAEAIAARYPAGATE